MQQPRKMMVPPGPSREVVGSFESRVRPLCKRFRPNLGTAGTCPRVPPETSGLQEIGARSFAYTKGCLQYSNSPPETIKILRTESLRLATIQSGMELRLRSC